MNEIKLKPCPFCGEEAEIISVYKQYAVTCKGCDVVSASHDTQLDAINEWNKRIGHETYKEYLDDHISWDAFPNATINNIYNYMCIRHFFGNDARAEDCGYIECRECWDREMP